MANQINLVPEWLLDVPANAKEFAIGRRAAPIVGFAWDEISCLYRASRRDHPIFDRGELIAAAGALQGNRPRLCGINQDIQTELLGYCAIESDGGHSINSELERSVRLIIGRRAGPYLGVPDGANPLLNIDLPGNLMPADFYLEGPLYVSWTQLRSDVAVMNASQPVYRGFDAGKCTIEALPALNLGEPDPFGFHHATYNLGDVIKGWGRRGYAASAPLEVNTNKLVYGPAGYHFGGWFDAEPFDVS